MAPRPVIAVGGSAGGVEVLLRFVAALPADVAAPVLVTTHVPTGSRSQLPAVLRRAGPLPAEHASHGAEAEPGRVYVAPPGAHLVLRDGRMDLDHGPRVNHVRPSVDVMLASVARAAGPGAVAVVLSGALDDGAVGAALVEQAGGAVLVQDPAEAEFPSMPRAALRAAPSGRALGSGDLARAAAERARQASQSSQPSQPSTGAQIPETTMSTIMADSDDPGYLAPDESQLTRLSCPECHGVLARADLPHISYFRCHTGHAWAPQALAAAQQESAEAALWTAVAALDEQGALARHLLRGAEPSPSGEPAEGDAAAARRASALARLLREHLGRPAQRA